MANTVTNSRSGTAALLLSSRIQATVIQFHDNSADDTYLEPYTLGTTAVATWSSATVQTLRVVFGD